MQLPSIINLQIFLHYEVAAFSVNLNLTSILFSLHLRAVLPSTIDKLAHCATRYEALQLNSRCSPGSSILALGP